MAKGYCCSQHPLPLHPPPIGYSFAHTITIAEEAQANVNVCLMPACISLPLKFVGARRKLLQGQVQAGLSRASGSSSSKLGSAAPHARLAASQTLAMQMRMCEYGQARLTRRRQSFRHGKCTVEHSTDSSTPGQLSSA